MLHVSADTRKEKKATPKNEPTRGPCLLQVQVALEVAQATAAAGRLARSAMTWRGIVGASATARQAHAAGSGAGDRAGDLPAGRAGRRWRVTRAMCLAAMPYACRMESKNPARRSVPPPSMAGNVSEMLTSQNRRGFLPPNLPPRARALGGAGGRGGDLPVGQVTGVNGDLERPGGAGDDQHRLLSLLPDSHSHSHSHSHRILSLVVSRLLIAPTWGRMRIRVYANVGINSFMPRAGLCRAGRPIAAGRPLLS